MGRTVYRNASGLPNDEQVTTAREQALLGRAIQERFPRFYRYFSTSSFTYHGETMSNHNHLLGRVEGVDGIKTGYTQASGFNLVTSVHRSNRHIVAVVLGGSSAGARDAKMRSLIEEHIARAATQHTAPLIAEGAVTMPVTRTAEAKTDTKAKTPSIAEAARPGATEAKTDVKVKTYEVASAPQQHWPASKFAAAAEAAESAAAAPAPAAPRPCSCQARADVGEVRGGCRRRHHQADPGQDHQGEARTDPNRGTCAGGERGFPERGRRSALQAPSRQAGRACRLPRRTAWLRPLLRPLLRWRRLRFRPLLLRRPAAPIDPTPALAAPAAAPAATAKTAPEETAVIAPAVSAPVSAPAPAEPPVATTPAKTKTPAAKTPAAKTGGMMLADAKPPVLIAPPPAAPAAAPTPPAPVAAVRVARFPRQPSLPR